MDLYEKIFNKFYKRLRLEGMLRALIIALIPSLAIAIALSVAFFILDINLMWITLIVFLATALILFIGLYFIKYRPKEKDVARRVDLEGLKERAITMVSNKDNNSLMAELQRKDTIKALNEASKIKLKLQIKKAPAIIMLVMLAMATISATLATLSLNGYLKGYEEIVSPENGYVEIRYKAGLGGKIIGEEIQRLKKDELGHEVMAKPDRGYIFIGWSDGNNEPVRSDSAKEANVLEANFMELNKALASGAIKDDMLPNKEDSNKEDSKADAPGSMPGASGEYIESNQVIDGNTYYRDVYNKYLNEALELLNNGKEIPLELRLLIEEYFQIIK